MLRILIVDDNVPLLSGMERYLGVFFSESEIDTAASAGECLKKLQGKGADILILDTHLLDSSGYDLCREIIAIKPDIKIIVLTGTLDISDVRKMMYAGASGYIVKTSITDEIVQGIESVMRGEKFISACVREYPPTPQTGG